MKKTETQIDPRKAISAATEVARTVGLLMRRNIHKAKKANEVTQHDIKLELDVRSQKIIERDLRRQFPTVALLGEEGVSGSEDAEYRWVVDPIDGTVNFSYGIPHACVSIALQRRGGRKGQQVYPDGYETLAGVVYDPFCNEMWTATTDAPSRCNGRVVQVSKRRRLEEAVISIGFAKNRETLDAMLPYFNELVYGVRKVRIMGAAALALTYVAMGRFDGYIERGIRLWDIAAGGLIIQQAGGDFWWEPAEGEYTFRMLATNGPLRRRLKMPS